MDFSIPPNLPVNVQENLDELIQDYKDANLTAKGYNTKRKQILDSVEASERSLSPGNNSVSSSSNMKSLSMKSSLSRRREPGHMRNMSLPTPLINRAPSSVLSDSSSITFPRTRGSVYRVTTTNSNRSRSSSGAPRIRKRRSTRTSLSSYDLMTSGGSYNPMVPLLPRNKVIKDNGKAHNRGSIESTSSALAGFTTSIPSILRARAENSGNETAIIGITSKGKAHILHGKSCTLEQKEWRTNWLGGIFTRWIRYHYGTKRRNPSICRGDPWMLYQWNDSSTYLV